MALTTNKLALRAGSLDSTPLAEFLDVARGTGWDAVELRRVDLDRARDAGQSADQVWTSSGRADCLFRLSAWAMAGCSPSARSATVY